MNGVFIVRNIDSEPHANAAMNAFPVRVGIIQSCYVPWRGFFDFIADVDLFVLFDDVQYPAGRSWRNRNRLKTGNGLRWITVPIPSGASKLPIDQVPIAGSPKPWQKEHREMMERAFATAPYRSEALAIWEESIGFGDTHLSQLNERLIGKICAYLDINTPIVQARSFAARGTKTDRLIDLLKKIGANTYLSGPSASAYIDTDGFLKAGIGLEFKVYDYSTYPQQWGDFENEVSVLDLIANCGPESKQFVRSRSPNRTITATIPARPMRESPIQDIDTSMECSGRV